MTEVAGEAPISVTVVDLFPAAPPVPTDEQIAEIRRRILTLIETDPWHEGGIPSLTHMLGHEDRERLVALCWHDAIRTQALQDEIYSAAASWTSQQRNILSLRPYRVEAQNRRRAMREQIAAARARARLAQRRQNDEEQGAVIVVDPPTRELTPDEMIKTESPWLIAVGYLLKLRPERLWFDTFYGRGFTDWDGSFNPSIVPARMRRDEDSRRIYTWLIELDPRLSNLQWTQAINLLDYVSERTQKNEPLDWLDSIEWDREPRLVKLLPHAYGTPNDDYHHALGVSWLMSMAKRIIEPGAKVDHMLVFIGPQEYAKSKSLEVMGGKWYSASTSEIGTKDFLEELRGKICVEIPELHNVVSSRADANKVKAMLSIATDHYRLPYGRVSQDFKRTAMFTGTTNERGWHTDPTGGRRFWPALVTHVVRCDWIAEHRAQLFAEAAHLVRQGLSWWDVPQAEQRAAIENEREISASEEALVAFLADPRLYDGIRSVPFTPPNRLAADDLTRWGSLVTMDRILTQCLSIPRDRHDQHVRKVSRIMRMLGWRVDRGRIGGATTRYWVREEAPALTAGQIMEQGGANNGAVTDVDEEIPF